MDVKRAGLLIGLMMLAAGCAGTDTSDTDGVIEITVKLSNFKITPPTITVNHGDSVKLIVQNVEGTHNLYIDGYDLRTDAASADNTQIIEFTADSAGEFATWCEVRDHKAKGMEGWLVVN